MREETRVVAVMMANNETGVVQVEEIGPVCRERGVHFHVDAVQAAKKIPIDVERIACDTLSLSAHKLHAPKGIGALFVRRGVAMSSHIHGGARRRRAGTENVPLAAAFGAAVALPDASAEMAAMRDRLELELQSLSVTINGRPHRGCRIHRT
jgi:cysteine desulfurase